jgi:hypothetical protein
MRCDAVGGSGESKSEWDRRRPVADHVILAIGDIPANFSGPRLRLTVAGLMILHLLGCVANIMLVQLFFPGRRLEAYLKIASRSVVAT